MIFESTLIMTIMDLAFIALASIGVVTLIRSRRHLTLGPVCTVMGLAVVGSLYAGDLVVMLVLPLVMDPERALEIMRQVHLNFSWPVNLGAASLVLIGVVQSTSSTTEVRTELEDYRHRLLSCLAASRDRGAQVQEAKQRVSALKGQLRGDDASLAGIAHELEAQIGPYMNNVRTNLRFIEEGLNEEQQGFAATVEVLSWATNENMKLIDDLSSRLRALTLPTAKLLSELESLAGVLTDDGELAERV